MWFELDCVPFAVLDLSIDCLNGFLIYMSTTQADFTELNICLLYEMNCGFYVDVERNGNWILDAWNINNERKVDFDSFERKVDDWPSAFQSKSAGRREHAQNKSQLYSKNTCVCIANDWADGIVFESIIMSKMKVGYESVV